MLVSYDSHWCQVEYKPGIPNTNNVDLILKKTLDTWRTSHLELIATIYNRLCIQIIDLGIEYKVPHDHLSTYLGSLFHI